MSNSEREHSNHKEFIPNKSSISDNYPANPFYTPLLFLLLHSPTILPTTFSYYSYFYFLLLFLLLHSPTFVTPTFSNYSYFYFLYYYSYLITKNLYYLNKIELSISTFLFKCKIGVKTRLGLETIRKLSPFSYFYLYIKYLTYCFHH